MARKGLTPVSGARGRFIRLDPIVPDPHRWLKQEFDWDANVAVVDMFCGAGGMSFGLDSVKGMRVVAGLERDPIAAMTHMANMPAPVFTGDVSEVEDFRCLFRSMGVRRVDILTGGPPCQGFSRLGKGALRRLALDDGRNVDLHDPRNWLFRHFMRAVRQLRPQVVVIENVPEMLGYTPIIEEIRGIFEDLDYMFEARVLRADQYGVPQRRSRLFMIANRNGHNVVWPKPRRYVRTLRDAIGDLPEVGPAHFEEEIPWTRPPKLGPYLRMMRAGLRGAAARVVYDHVTRAHRAEDIAAFRHMRQGDRYGAVPVHLRRYRDNIFADKYHRMIWDAPSWTVTAHLAKDGYKYIHPEQHRTISVREAARIQSFPDRFRFAGSRTHRFAQIGNAVPPLLAAELGRSLLALID